MRVFSLTLLLAATASLFLTSSSQAQNAHSATIVLGSGLGRDCFLATLAEPNHLSDLKALELCDKAVGEFNMTTRDRAATFINRSYIELRLANYRDVLADSDRGIAIAPQIAEAYLNRGAGLIGLQRYDEAIAALNKSLDVGLAEPQYAYFDRGLAKEFMGDDKGAYFDLKKTLEIDPKFQLAADELTRFVVTPAPPAQ